MKSLFFSTALLASSTSLMAAPLVIDDFNYNNVTELRANWIHGGAASTSGAPFFVEGGGVDGTNAMRHFMNWANNAAAAWLHRSFPSGTLDLSEFTAISVMSYVIPRPTFTQTEFDPQFRVRITGANGAEWQTKIDAAHTIDISAWDSFVFPLNEEVMERVSGQGSLVEALVNVTNIQLRFTNESTSGHEIVYIDDLIALARVPEPAEWVLEFSTDLANWDTIELTPEMISNTGAIRRPDGGDRGFYRMRILSEE